MASQPSDWSLDSLVKHANQMRAKQKSERELEHINHVLAAVLRIADQALVDRIDDEIQAF